MCSSCNGDRAEINVPELSKKRVSPVALLVLVNFVYRDGGVVPGGAVTVTHIGARNVPAIEA